MSEIKLQLNKMPEETKAKLQEYMKWFYTTFRENPLASTGQRYVAFSEEDIVMVKMEPVGKGFIELEDIVVPPGMQKKGLGSKAMQLIVDAADKIGVVLKLNAEPYMRNISNEDLEAWYTKFGFEDDVDAYGGYGYDMVRFPKNDIKESKEVDEEEYNWEFQLDFKKIGSAEEKKLGFNQEQFSDIIDGSDILTRESFFDFGATNKFVKIPNKLKKEFMEMEDVIFGYNDDYMVHWAEDRKAGRFYFFRYIG